MSINAVSQPPPVIHWMVPINCLVNSLSLIKKLEHSTRQRNSTCSHDTHDSCELNRPYLSHVIVHRNTPRCSRVTVTSCKKNTISLLENDVVELHAGRARGRDDARPLHLDFNHRIVGLSLHVRRLRISLQLYRQEQLHAIEHVDRSYDVGDLVDHPLAHLHVVDSRLEFHVILIDSKLLLTIQFKQVGDD